MTRTYSEILISNEPDSDLFKSLSDRLKTEFKAELIERVEDLDSKYFDFKIKDKVLTLHLQNYIGITLFPKGLNDATENENLFTEVVGFKLKYSTSDFDTWVKIKDQAEAEINYVLENVQEARSDKAEYEFTTYKDYANCEGHEHCEICNSVVSCNDTENNLYSTLRHLTCPDCYKKYVENDDYLKEIERLEKIKKLPPTRAIPNKGFVAKLKGWFS
jgi:frataxin-like iron-binding protein CyaY